MFALYETQYPGIYLSEDGYIVDEDGSIYDDNGNLIQEDAVIIENAEKKAKTAAKAAAIGTAGALIGSALNTARTANRQSAILKKRAANGSGLAKLALKKINGGGLYTSKNVAVQKIANRVDRASKSGAIKGAGAGLAAYGAYKLYKHFKNKKKD